MKAAWLSVLLCAVALGGASATPLELERGSWERTDLLRNFSISGDGRHEVEGGGSGPNTERVCLAEQSINSSDLYPGLKNPTLAKLCKVTTISETPTLIDSIVECSAHDAMPPYITHTVVSASTPKSFTTITETTFLRQNYDGGISRSTMYSRGRWLEDKCNK